MDPSNFVRGVKIRALIHVPPPLKAALWGSIATREPAPGAPPCAAMRFPLTGGSPAARWAAALPKEAEVGSKPRTPGVWSEVVPEGVEPVWEALEDDDDVGRQLPAFENCWQGFGGT